MRYLSILSVIAIIITIYFYGFSWSTIFSFLVGTVIGFTFTVGGIKLIHEKTIKKILKSKENEKTKN